jgi:hypothetical protein
MPTTQIQIVTLSDSEILQLADSLRSRDHLYFTNLANKREVAKAAKLLGIKTRSRTAHGSLLDPRYTVEGSHLLDKGLGNDYKHYHPKLYCLEVDRWY